MAVALAAFALLAAGSALADTAAVRGNPYAEGLQPAIAGNYQGALASFEQVLEQDPQHLNALFNAARAHRQLGQTQAALQKLYRVKDATEEDYRNFVERSFHTTRQRFEDDQRAQLAVRRRDTP